MSTEAVFSQASRVLSCYHTHSSTADLPAILKIMCWHVEEQTPPTTYAVMSGCISQNRKYLQRTNASVQQTVTVADSQRMLLRLGVQNRVSSVIAEDTRRDDIGIPMCSTHNSFVREALTWAMMKIQTHSVDDVFIVLIAWLKVRGKRRCQETCQGGIYCKRANSRVPSSCIACPSGYVLYIMYVKARRSLPFALEHARAHWS